MAYHWSLCLHPTGGDHHHLHLYLTRKSSMSPTCNQHVTCVWPVMWPVMWPVCDLSCDWPACDLCATCHVTCHVTNINTAVSTNLEALVEICDYLSYYIGWNEARDTQVCKWPHSMLFSIHACTLGKQIKFTLLLKALVIRAETLFVMKSCHIPGKSSCCCAYCSGPC